jgi:enoyl-CoA hydratase/carnithine racemase
LLHLAHALPLQVMNAELVHFLDKLAHPESKARVVILRGAGKAFSAGGDIKNLEKAMLEHR